MEGAAAAAAALADAGGLKLDRPGDAEAPFTPEEAEQVRQGLDFIRRWRKVLRLPLNDAENLLVDGVRPPERRGQVRHLLAKVDKAAALAALARKPVSDDPKARTALLEGVARVSGDLDVLLMWLEALPSDAGRDEAAAAFGAVAERIDFAALSPTRTNRLLGALEAAFAGADRVLALFGLLESASFRAAFEASAVEIDAGAAGRLRPLAAVHRAFVLRQGPRRGDDVDAGLRSMLAAPPAVLKGYRAPVREALLDAAVRRGGPADAVEALLRTLPRDGEAFQEQAWAWACRQVAAGREDAGAALLGKVKGTRAEALARALAAPRVGGFALVQAGDDPDSPGLRAAYDLGRQRTVLLRLGRPADSAAVALEAAMQAALCLPGVAPPLAAGMGDRGTPYVAMASGPGALPAAARDLDPDAALALAWDGVRILRALASVGVVLPDAAPGRFRGGPAGGGLELVDLGGAREARVADALLAHRGLAQDFARRCLAWPPLSGGRPRRETPAPVRALLDSEAPPDYPGWAALVICRTDGG